jgi:hypothetical protein
MSLLHYLFFGSAYFENLRPTEFPFYSDANISRRRDVAQDTQQWTDPLRQGAHHCNPATSAGLLRSSRVEDAY